jgi:flagellar protein FliS
MDTLGEKVASASPAELIDMLYARCVQDLHGAKMLFELQGDPRSQADAIHQVVHAQQILAELNKSVNHEQGGDLAVNLSRIYDYCQHRLTEAVSKRDAGAVKEVLGLVSELHGAWQVMLEKHVKKSLGQA